MAAAHRAAFLAAMVAEGDGAVAVLCTGPEQIRSRDTHYRFRPDSDFWYVTAFAEPEAVAVLLPGRAEGEFVLFVRPRDPELETWNGRRAGVEGARELYGADEAHPLEELDTRLPKLLRGAQRLYYRTGMDVDFDRKVLGWLASSHVRSRDGITAPATVVQPGTLLHELRLRKSSAELAIMRRASEITREAHVLAMSMLAPGMHEFEIEAAVDGTFRRRGGWGPGYPSIVAGGANACILHYTENNQPVGDGDLLLLDAGCEVDGYTADVTRTFPASGRFEGAARDLYEVVLAANQRGVEHVSPGHTFASVHDETTAVLVDGMLSVGLLSGSVEENIESGAYRRYYMHKTGHWLGIDVHDVGPYFVSANGHATAGGAGHPTAAAALDPTRSGAAPGMVSRPLEPGMITTVEPGLYIPADDADAPESFRGLGIRIEDDVVVTADGHENLSAGIPKTVADVEASCSG